MSGNECRENEYQDGSNEEACKPASKCAQGQRVTTPHTPTSDVQCGPCDAGSFQDLAEHRDLVCNPVTVCDKDEYVSVPATGTTDQVPALTPPPPPPPPPLFPPFSFFFYFFFFCWCCFVLLFFFPPTLGIPRQKRHLSLSVSTSWLDRPPTLPPRHLNVRQGI